MYGLKQAPRLWYQELTQFLISQDFSPLPSDPCVFQNCSRDLLVIWVDDIVGVASSPSHIKNLDTLLSSRYAIRDLGPLTEYLGLSIHRDRPSRSLYLTQPEYIQKIVHRYHLGSCLPVSSPSTGIDIFPSLRSTATPDQQHYYQAMLGSLMYLVIWTRPDLAERCSRLSQFAHCPAPEHESALCRVFAYLLYTPTLGLRFQGSTSSSLELHSLGFHGYSDASYGDNLHDRKSTSRYLFKLGGGCVSWKSRKQPVIATSSTEAEYVAYSLAGKEALWLRRLLLELHCSTSDIHTVLLYGDNQPALALTLNPEHHSRTKHIDIPFHFICEHVRQGTVRLQYLSTKDMPADGLTKPLSGIKFSRFVQLLDMQSPPALT